MLSAMAASDKRQADEDLIREAVRHEESALRHRLMSWIWLERGDTERSEAELLTATLKAGAAAELRTRVAGERAHLDRGGDDG